MVALVFKKKGDKRSLCQLFISPNMFPSLREKGSMRTTWMCQKRYVIFWHVLTFHHGMHQKCINIRFVADVTCVGSHFNTPMSITKKITTEVHSKLSTVVETPKALLNIHIFDVPHTFAGCLCRFFGNGSCFPCWSKYSDRIKRPICFSKETEIPKNCRGKLGCVK